MKIQLLNYFSVFITGFELFLGADVVIIWDTDEADCILKGLIVEVMLWIVAFLAVSFAILLKIINDSDDRKQNLWKRKWDDDAQEQALAEMRKEKEAKEEEKRGKNDEMSEEE